MIKKLGLPILSVLLLVGCGGGSGGDSTSLQIKPTVSATNDKTVSIGEEVILNATANDSDGNIVSYSWKQGSTTISENKSYTYTAAKIGTTTYSITVTDDDGLTASDEMKVNVTVERLKITVDGTEYSESNKRTSKKVSVESSNVSEINVSNEVSIAITGGADKDLFVYEENKLKFKQKMDYANPTDSNTDNIYVVKITATDASLKTIEHTLEFTLYDETFMVESQSNKIRNHDNFSAKISSLSFTGTLPSKNGVAILDSTKAGGKFTFDIKWQNWMYSEYVYCFFQNDSQETVESLWEKIPGSFTKSHTRNFTYNAGYKYKSEVYTVTVDDSKYNNANFPTSTNFYVKICDKKDSEPDVKCDYASIPVEIRN